MQVEALGKDPIWRAAILIVGLSLSAAWVILIGYGLVSLVVEYAI